MQYTPNFDFQRMVLDPWWRCPLRVPLNFFLTALPLSSRGEGGYLGPPPLEFKGVVRSLYSTFVPQDPALRHLTWVTPVSLRRIVAPGFNMSMN